MKGCASYDRLYYLTLGVAMRTCDDDSSCYLYDRPESNSYERLDRNVTSASQARSTETTHMWLIQVKT